jgi:hypothetical protein
MAEMETGTDTSRTDIHTTVRMINSRIVIADNFTAFQNLK